MKYLGINTGDILFALKGTNVWQRHVSLDDNGVDGPGVSACGCCIPFAIKASLEEEGIDYRKNDETNHPSGEEWEDVLRQHNEAPRVYQPR